MKCPVLGLYSTDCQRAHQICCVFW